MRGLELDCANLFRISAALRDRFGTLLVYAILELDHVICMANVFTTFTDRNSQRNGKEWVAGESSMEGWTCSLVPRSFTLSITVPCRAHRSAGIHRHPPSPASTPLTRRHHNPEPRVLLHCRHSQILFPSLFITAGSCVAPSRL